jgi:hypothetical protein
MPLPGGDADKAGNRYELRWTVRQLIRLLTDEAVYYGDTLLFSPFSLAPRQSSAKVVAA